LIGVLGSHRFEELFRSANYPVEYVDWVDYEKLPEQLAEFDIGVMPLLDDAWARGKCGYKALLYMSCGIPTVCSPVGVNREIIEDGVNGFLAESTEDWANKLGRLVDDAELRRRFAEKGRKTVVEEFSVRAVFPEFLSALRMQARLR
jgi:glycosyltransferase involved in cell wall biosynthesis